MTRKATPITVAEQVIKSLLATAGPKAFAIALNNASFHGEVFIENGIELDDDDVVLGKWYDGIEKLIAASDKMY